MKDMRGFQKPFFMSLMFLLSKSVSNQVNPVNPVQKFR